MIKPVRQNNETVWFNKVFRTGAKKSPTEVQRYVLQHLSELVDEVNNEMIILNLDYERLVDAIDFTIYEKLLQIALRVKAFERLAHEARLKQHFIISENGIEGSIAEVLHSMMNKITLECWRISDKYSRPILKLLARNSLTHISKTGKFMQVKKPNNYLERLYDRLFYAPEVLRDMVCTACGWSPSTFFSRKANRVVLKKQRILDHPLTEAESEKIIKIIRETIIPSLAGICEEWENQIEQKKV